MAAKRNKAAPTADEEVDSLFEGIADAKKNPAKKTPAKPIDDDPLADLESELNTQHPPSRPHTPRAAPAARRSDEKGAHKSEDKPAAAARKSTDSARSLRASLTPSATSSEPQDTEKKAAQEGGQQGGGGGRGGGGGGWWGSIFTQASAAMKTAEAAVKDLQQHEEAKKWAEHVRGNVGVLRGFGTLVPPKQLLSVPHSP